MFRSTTNVEENLKIHPTHNIVDILHGKACSVCDRCTCHRPSHLEFVCPAMEGVVLADEVYRVYCPRCDREYTSEVSRADAMEKVKKHVPEQHPDHDPEWWDTA